MKVSLLIFFILLASPLNAQVDEKIALPDLLRAELQELEASSKQVDVILPEKIVAAEEENKAEKEITEEAPIVEENVAMQAAAPVREEAEVRQTDESTPKQFLRSRDSSETEQKLAPEETTAKNSSPAMPRQRTR